MRNPILECVTVKKYFHILLGGGIYCTTFFESNFTITSKGPNIYTL